MLFLIVAVSWKRVLNSSYFRKIILFEAILTVYSKDKFNCSKKKKTKLTIECQYLTEWQKLLGLGLCFNTSDYSVPSSKLMVQSYDVGRKRDQIRSYRGAAPMLGLVIDVILTADVAMNHQFTSMARHDSWQSHHLAIVKPLHSMYIQRARVSRLHLRTPPPPPPPLLLLFLVAP